MSLLLWTIVAAALLCWLFPPYCVQGEESSLFSQRRKRKRRTRTTQGEDDLFAAYNVSCHFYRQPLNHFELPSISLMLDDQEEKTSSSNHQKIPTTPTTVIAQKSYTQRYCVSNHFVRDPFARAPVFFYTGNESPLEEYVQNTGLMWELAEVFHAQVVFAEHRYEGQSLPDPSIPHCLAYSSSIQAITDFARLIRNVFLVVQDDENRTTSIHNNNNNGICSIRPVITFGGSYGGMLSAWMRMRYPQWTAGAISASAPLGGFPTYHNNRDAVGVMEAAFAVIRRGLQQPYPPNATNTVLDNHCPDNVLASFPLIQILGQDRLGLDFLTRTFSLCEPLVFHTKDSFSSSASYSTVANLLDWLQTPWFDLAEGSYPYPSSYIPFALTHRTDVKLPTWPLQHACWKTGLHLDYGVRIVGNRSNVTFTVILNGMVQSNPYNYTIQVDWDQATTSTHVRDWIAVPAMSEWFQSLKRAVSVWYNMTQDVSCFNISEAAPNLYEHHHHKSHHRKFADSGGAVAQDDMVNKQPVLTTATAQHEKRIDSVEHVKSVPSDSTQLCQDRIQKTGSWPSLCCNEDLNLIITYTKGTGSDIFWPPSVPRSVQTYANYVEYYNLTKATNPFCADPDGIFGFPRQSDPWSWWLELQYGNSRIWETASNILFSNGLLDPWSAGGVYPNTVPRQIVPGLIWQKGKRGMAALLLEHGGHHVDLMFSDPENDPPAFAAARKVEQRYVESWIRQFWEQQEFGFRPTSSKILR